MSIEHKPHKLVQSILISSIKAFLQSRSKIVIERNDTLDLKPPYIILSNHVTNWDPLLINCFVSEPICFVAGEPLFRHPLLRKILYYVGAIPKTKFKSDTRTIKGILKAKKHNRVIGLFPEGNRNWDGKTEPLTYTTAKLVKSLNIPVVTATIAGGYLSQPRWGNGHRKGTISISFTKLCDEGDLSNESVDSIHHKLTKALYHDEMEWQSKLHYQYEGKALAHYLERLLFLCPHCKLPGHLHSEEDLFYCQSCHYIVRYTTLGTFEEIKQPVHFETTRDWNEWQLDYLKANLLDQDFRPIWNKAMNDPVKLFTSDGKQPFSQMATGTIRLDETSLILQAKNGKTHLFRFDEIDGLNIHLHNRLDFFTNNILHRFEFYKPRTSAYKWLKIIQLLQESPKV